MTGIIDEIGDEQMILVNCVPVEQATMLANEVFAEFASIGRLSKQQTSNVKNLLGLLPKEVAMDLWTKIVSNDRTYHVIRNVNSCWESDHDFCKILTRIFGMERNQDAF